MTRTEARKTAVGLIYSMRSNGRQAEEVLADFFDEEYYSTLSAEDEIFSDLPKKKNLEYIRNVVTLCEQHEDELTVIIADNAKGWKENRISDVASAIIRCALSEIIFIEDIPVGASVKDAVDITKTYADDRTADFVNAILRSYLRNQENTDKTEQDA